MGGAFQSVHARFAVHLPERFRGPVAPSAAGFISPALSREGCLERVVVWNMRAGAARDDCRISVFRHERGMSVGMRVVFLLCVLANVLACEGALADPAESLCAQNPAFSLSIMLKIVQAELEVDHDPALDADTPENIARQAQTQGIAECAAEVRGDPSITAAFGGLSAADQPVAWDAYNTTCADHKASRGACITAEVQSDKALKRMVATDKPEGAKALVQA